MAITNISKEHLEELILSLNKTELEDSKVIQKIQRNSNNYSKIKTLYKQYLFIKNELEEIVRDTIETNNLEKVKCNFKKICGNNYYLYNHKIKNELFFSIIAYNEWNNDNIEYLGKYLYDYDHTLNKVD
tara:strand:- start:347 stop:733 length:387 start_codon:yes stop_codon:yes gene_type:complete